MARKFLNSKVIKNKNTLQRYKKASSQILIDGIPTDPAIGGKETKVRQIASNMKKAGSLEPTSNNSLQSLSLKILTAAGCSLEMSKEINRRDYTLMSDQIDIETVNNPNKLDPKQFKKIKKQKISIDSVFKRTDDAIFTLDAALPRMYLESKEKETPTPSVTRIVESLVDISYLNNSSKPLRGLK
tara:strand:- start:43 stop:597 length:555 start_codon:yes stop_codon:yes gene_type:complete